MKRTRQTIFLGSALLTAALAAAGCSDNGGGGDGDGDGDGDTGGSAIGDGDGDTGGGTGDGGTGGSNTGGQGGGNLGGQGGAGNGPELKPIEAVFSGSSAAADGLYGISLTAHGLIYVAGAKVVDTDDGGGEVLDTHTVVARYTAAGELDTDFGDEGVVLINAIAAADDEAAANDGKEETVAGSEGSSAVAALPDGGVIVAIEANDGALGGEVILARLDADGEPVGTFGTAGLAPLPLSGWTTDDWTDAEGEEGPKDRVYDIRLDTSGDEDRLVVFGSAPAPAGGGRLDNDRYVARVFVEDGSFDESFGDDGLFSIDFGELEGSDGARRGTVLADGSSYSFGYTNYGDEGGRHHIQILHLDAQGAPVEGFGFRGDETTCGTAQDGVICSNPFLADDGFAEAYSGAVLANGSLVTTGYGRPDDADLPPDLVSFRFGPTSMDSTYGTSGAFMSDSGAEDRGRDVAVLEDGRIVHVGKHNGVAAIYVTTKGGVLWDGFGEGGVQTYSHDGNFRAVATQGGVIAAVADSGSTDPQNTYLVILQVGE